MREVIAQERVVDSKTYGTSTIYTKKFVLTGDEIVRCRDCKNYRPAEDDEHEDGCALAYAYLFETSPDGFCAWGERRE